MKNLTEKKKQTLFSQKLNSMQKIMTYQEDYNISDQIILFDICRSMSPTATKQDTHLFKCIYFKEFFFFLVNSAHTQDVRFFIQFSNIFVFFRYLFAYIQFNFLWLGLCIIEFCIRQKIQSMLVFVICDGPEFNRQSRKGAFLSLLKCFIYFYIGCCTNVYI